MLMIFHKVYPEMTYAQRMEVMALMAKVHMMGSPMMNKMALV